MYFKKLITLACILLLGTISGSLAGDFAQRHIHGFSIDGQLFAFEEYGVQDGSGFPYSNIYVIDTSSDKWTANSPFRVLLKDETKTVFDAREEARILAGPVMKSFEDRGEVVATNRASEIPASPHRMEFRPRQVVPPIDDTIILWMEEISYTPRELCSGFGPTKGFRLLQIDLRADSQTKLLSEDKSVPDSRGCPLRYSFADVITYYPEEAAPVMAVLIRMETIGFEGPDGRYLAVTTDLE